MQYPSLWLAAVAITACTAPLARAEQPGDSFDVQVPLAPMLRSVDGINEVAYELRLDNFARTDLLPVRVDILDASSARVLATFEGPALEQRLDLSGMQWRAESYAAIPSGRRGVVFIELGLSDPMPQALRHRIRYAQSAARTTLATVDGGTVSIVAGRTPVLSPPLQGGPWVAVYDPRWTRGHRRVGYAIGGKLRTPGRYAIDWVKLDDTGRKAPTGSDLAAHTYSYGQAVLAVADGVVRRVHDQAIERTRLSEAPTSSVGNSVVIELDNGHFAHYGHLRQGSVTVIPGARVKAGDKVAEVGFSGSASDPQLHFALTDGPDELASEGIAYSFDHYRLLGRFDDGSRLGTSAWTPAASAGARRAAVPAALSVVGWGVAGD